MDGRSVGPGGQRPEGMSEDYGSPISWLLTPTVAGLVTLLGAVGVFYGSAGITEALAGDRSVCDVFACGLGVGVVLLTAGVLAVVLAGAVGLVIGLVRLGDRRPRAALRRGLVVATCCLVADIAVAALAYWPGLVS